MTDCRDDPPSPFWDRDSLFGQRLAASQATYNLVSLVCTTQLLQKSSFLQRLPL